MRLPIPRTTRTIFLLCSLFALGVPVLAQNTVPVRGRIVDADGRFSAVLYIRRPTVALVALDLDGGRGGTFVVDREQPDREAVVVLEPLVQVHGTLATGESGPANETLHLWVSDSRAIIAVAGATLRPGDFSFRLPPATYELSISAKDLDPLRIPVNLGPEERELDLGRIDLRPTNLATHYGKEPPPCLSRRLPALTRLYEEYRDHRDKFEILAFHNTSVQSFEELDGKMERIVEKLWNGEDLPFPVLLDNTHTTYTNFSVRALGTCVLIDPEGRLVRGGDEAGLEAGIRELIEAGDGRPPRRSSEN